MVYEDSNVRNYKNDDEPMFDGTAKIKVVGVCLFRVVPFCGKI